MSGAARVDLAVPVVGLAVAAVVAGAGGEQAAIGGQPAGVRLAGRHPGVQLAVHVGSRVPAVRRAVDRALDQVLTARSSIGSRLQELEALETTTEDMAVHYDEELSRLQDLDYAQALTDLQRRQFNLEAAQKSFMLVNSLSLFDLL